MSLFKKKQQEAAENTAGETSAAENQDEELFKSLSKSKKLKRRKKITAIIIIVAIVAVIGVIGVIYARHKVRENFSSGNDDVTSYAATVGSISTTISGKGNIANVDEETLTLPAGVEIIEVEVEAYSTVEEGDIIATVDLDTVMTAMADVQSELDDLDEDISDAASDTVESSVTAGVAGRVKKICAEAGDDVANVMYSDGALAELSLDGYMAVEIETDKLSEGEEVTVCRSNGKEITGTVDTCGAGKATVLVSDDGPEPDESVTVTDKDGNFIGSGKLYIHSPLKVTGITGTISRVNTRLNAKVSSSTRLFTLKDTSYSGDYDALLKEREELEDTLIELVHLYRDGALLAPFSGSVSSVDYDEDTWDEETETDVITLSPDESMSVTINIDESNILSLELGQTAQITISSVGEDSFNGELTEINKTATSSSGVTKYTAVVTFDKVSGMLAGMTASVVIRIQGVDDAVIIPVDALHQTSSTSYVYTSYDEETGEFGGMVQVTAGISNSSYVEITEGLSEGDVVWYTEEESWNFGNFSFGGGSNGGDMPDMGGDFGGGGGMPSGGGDFGGGQGGGMPGGR